MFPSFETRQASGLLNISVFLIWLVGCALLAPPAEAQTNLIPFNHVWKYQVFTNDPGTSWRLPDFDDSGWTNGASVLIYPANEPIPSIAYSMGATIQTLLPSKPGVGLPYDAYYFRTTFRVDSVPAYPLLTFTNLIDDGAVFYLNGVEIAPRYNMPTGTVTMTTGARTQAEPAIDGPSWFFLAATNLVQDTNYLAAEVHQYGTTSSDAMLGFHLTLTPGSPPVFVTNLPSVVDAEIGTVVTLSPTVAATPAPRYQWHRNGVKVPAATNASYSFTVYPTNIGIFHLEATNIFGVGTSQLAEVRDFAVPVVITSQPPSLVVLEQMEVGSISASASGTLPAYQWQKEAMPGSGLFTNIPNATQTICTIPTGSLGTNLYRMVVTNWYYSATSQVSQVMVLPDGTGPALVAATQEQDGPRYLIRLQFSDARKQMLPASLANAGSYTVTELGSNRTLTVTNATASGSLSATLFLAERWLTGSNYLVMVNNVQDFLGNVIAPDSQIELGYWLTNACVRMDHWWRWSEEGVDLDTAWRTNLLADRVYGEGQGVFTSAFGDSTPCTGSERTLVSFGPITHYFATTFLHEHAQTNGTLLLRWLADDGVVFYLNGREIHRVNMPAGQPAYASLASATVGKATCASTSVTVSNLVSGTNFLAAELHQSAAASYDAAFGAEVTLAYLMPPVLPPSAGPQLNIRQEGEVVTLWWSGGGYALEAVDSLGGLWRETQPNMVNPYQTSLTNSVQKLWRLHRK